MLLEKLSSLRESMGWVYGSEDLCVLLYSLVKRMRPRIVVELGTGFGVTAAWMAGALRENGSGVIHTYDNGSHFSSEPGIRFVEGLQGPLADSLREMGRTIPLSCSTYSSGPGSRITLSPIGRRSALPRLPRPPPLTAE